MAAQTTHVIFMPVFDKKKAGEEALVWLSVIGILTVLFLVGRAVIRTPPLLVAVTIVTPLIGFIWCKKEIALFDNQEMKNVALCMFITSFFCSIFIGATNGKVESYLQKLFLKGETVQYEMYVDEQEIYDGRKTIPPHYEKAYRFEPANPNHWMVDFLYYFVIFICFVIPIINYKILGLATVKTDKMKADDVYKVRRKKFISRHIN